MDAYIAQTSISSNTFVSKVLKYHLFNSIYFDC